MGNSIKSTIMALAAGAALVSGSSSSSSSSMSREDWATGGIYEGFLFLDQGVFPTGDNVVDIATDYEAHIAFKLNDDGTFTGNFANTGVENSPIFGVWERTFEREIRMQTAAIVTAPEDGTGFGGGRAPQGQLCYCVRARHLHGGHDEHVGVGKHSLRLLHCGCGRRDTSHGH